MNSIRKRLLASSLFAAILLWTAAIGCQSPARTLEIQPHADRTKDLAKQINASLDSAEKFLLAAQSPDGAWRSSFYGFMKDGPSLTPHVAASLLELKDDQANAACHRARSYL